MLDTPYHSLDEAKQARLPEQEFQQLIELEQHLTSSFNATKQQISAVEEELQALEKSPFSQLTFTTEQLETEQQQVQQALDQINQEIGLINSKLEDNLNRAEKLKSWQNELTALTLEFEDWQYLHGLIGSQKGDKFRKFAQGLTLDNLIYLANKQLEKLTGTVFIKT